MSTRRRRLGLGVVAGAVLCLAAYVSASYILSPAVADQGGGVANSSNYEVSGSVGGLALGAAQSTNYRCEVGGITMLESQGG